jgi:hypothetical protein
MLIKAYTRYRIRRLVDAAFGEIQEDTESTVLTTLSENRHIRYNGTPRHQRPGV